MKLGLVQYDICWEDKTASKEKLLSLLEKNKASSADWLIFPEMTLTGFSLDLKKTEFDSTDVDFFKAVAKKYNSYVTFGGVFNKNNRAVTVDTKGNIINEYSKQHLFGYGNETSYYEAGKNSKNRELFDMGGLKIMPSVCYDLRFSYLFWDYAKNTDVFFVIASWPKSRREHWKTLLRSRAIDNQCYVVGVNRVGSDPKLEYAGDSCVYGPFGEEIINCGDKEAVFFAEISKEQVIKVRKEYPFLNDRVK